MSSYSSSQFCRTMHQDLLLKKYKSPFYSSLKVIAVVVADIRFNANAKINSKKSVRGKGATVWM